MQQIITAKLKLVTTPEQHQRLRQTQVAFRDALNYVSRYAFEQGKISSNERLQQRKGHLRTDQERCEKMGSPVS
jgi:putative transposase